MTAIARIICRPALIPGFALAGVTAQAVCADEEVESLVAGFRSRGDVGVVLLEEAIYDALPDETRARLDRSATPVVVPFPGPSWTEAATAEARVVDLLRRAIGYRVRLR
jgi:vacuolar-type H+-ATPase subunit F/Vma7